MNKFLGIILFVFSMYQLTQSADISTVTWGGFGLNFGTNRLNVNKLNTVLKEYDYTTIPKNIGTGGLDGFLVTNGKNIIGLYGNNTNYPMKSVLSSQIKFNYHWDTITPGFVFGTNEFFYGIVFNISGFDIDLLLTKKSGRSIKTKDILDDPGDLKTTILKGKSIGIGIGLLVS